MKEIMSSMSSMSKAIVALARKSGQRGAERFYTSRLMRYQKMPKYPLSSRDRVSIPPIHTLLSSQRLFHFLLLPRWLVQLLAILDHGVVMQSILS
jgi:hypothetical protein